MKIGKIELTRERLVIGIVIAIAVIILGAYNVFYAPLIRELKTKHLEYKSTENEVLECRNSIESAGKGEKVLTREENVSQAIDELTKRGKLNSINFISMSPKKIEKEKGTEHKVLPINMEIESAYEDLAAFLGSLDDLEKGLVKVKSFKIVPDKEDPSKLKTDLVVNMYLCG